MAERWYRDGLSFECTQCGHCCTGETGYVWMTLAEIDVMAEHVGLSRQDFGSRYLRKVGRRYSLIEKPNGDCIFWDKGCTVYSVRPTQCRTYPFWPEVLRSRRAWNEESEECPGVSKSPGPSGSRFYSADQIDIIRKGDDEASAKD